MRTLHDPAARESLEVRLRGLGPDAPARWGRMSVDQMLWHVNTALKMALGEVDCEPVDGFLSRTVMKLGALFGPWPKGKVSTNRELVARGRYDFDEQQAELSRLIEVLGSRELGGAFPRHAVFGPMSGWQWSRLEFRHVDYHLRQFGA